MKIRHVGTILFSLLAIESALAEDGVFDFEDDAQVAAWWSRRCCSARRRGKKA